MYKRIFLIVLDSLGIGNAKDAKKFDDVGSNTLNSVLSVVPPRLPGFKKLGLLNLSNTLAYHEKNYEGIISKLNEVSVGKDMISGHYEIMGLKVEKLPVNFAKEGMPKELVEELETRWGRKIIGNKCSKGMDIIKELGERQLKTGEVIVYTSKDSVLQIATNDFVIPVKELYKMCEIAREVTNSKEEWKVDRIIARPFTGTNIGNFTKKINGRKDYAVSPFAPTYLDNLQLAGYDVIGIGKINDIFNGNGITYYDDAKSNIDGMDKTINIAKTVDFTGLCFVNLSELDSEYAHKRNPLGYLRALEDIDIKLRSLINNMRGDDLLILTSSHGNDPGYKGNEHTREQVPFVAYSKSLANKGHMISSQNSFACIGATIIDNFNVKPKEHQIGTSLLSMIK